MRIHALCDDEEVMKIFSIERRPTGRVVVFVFGIKVFSYKKKTVIDELYAKRFDAKFSLQDKETILKAHFYQRVGYPLNLENPKTFNEKMQWLKLYYFEPLLPVCGCKDTAKDYVKEKIGSQYIVPEIASFDSVDDIDFAKLPNQFVLKVNWGSSQNIIVKNKEEVQPKKIIKKLKKWMQKESCHYYHSFEPSYKTATPKILCEEYIGALSENLTCYKIFTFGSKPYLIQTVFDDKTPFESINYYDTEWNKLALKQNYPNNTNNVAPPKHLSTMLELAEILAQPFPHFVRVDFFEVGEQVLFSEFTFYSDNGMAPFTPPEWDRKLGDLIQLPEKRIMEE